MAREIIMLVEDAPEGGYVARALGHSISTKADMWEELKEAVRDAIRCHFDEEERPELVHLHVVREEVMAACGCPQTLVVASWPYCFGTTDTR